MVVVDVDAERAAVVTDVASDDTNDAAFAEVVANDILSTVVAGAATLLAVLIPLRSSFDENDAPLFRRWASVMIS